MSARPIQGDVHRGEGDTLTWALKRAGVLLTEDVTKIILKLTHQKNGSKLPLSSDNHPTKIVWNKSAGSILLTLGDISDTEVPAGPYNVLITVYGPQWTGSQTWGHDYKGCGEQSIELNFID